MSVLRVAGDFDKIECKRMFLNGTENVKFFVGLGSPLALS
jgi:hypothetical protein